MSVAEGLGCRAAGGGVGFVVGAWRAGLAACESVDAGRGVEDFA